MRSRPVGPEDATGPPEQRNEVPVSETTSRSSLRSQLDVLIRRRLPVELLGFDPSALPAASDFYSGQVAAEYDLTRERRGIFRWEEDVVRRLLEGLEPGARVLDVPVGTGRFLPVYLQLGLEVVGLDASADMLTEASRRFDPNTDPVALTKGSATALPFSDGSFDALVCFRFLPGKLTLRQTRTALREFARVTRGDVLVLLKVGERKFPSSWRDEFSRLGTRPEHELREILAESGLEVRHIEPAPEGPKAVFVCRRDERAAVSGRGPRGRR